MYSFWTDLKPDNLAVKNAGGVQPVLQGDFNRTDLSLKLTPLVFKSGMECKVKDMYSIFNREWAGEAKTSGLDRMIS